MSVYRVALTPAEDIYLRLVDDPESALREVRLATSTTQFQLHLTWPSKGALHLIVEGEQSPDELVGVLTDALGATWEPQWTHIEAAAEPPTTLDAGEQAAWVVRMALEPDDERCDVCHYPMPLHHRAPPPPCPCGEADNDLMLNALDPSSRGSGSDAVPQPEKVGI